MDFVTVTPQLAPDDCQPWRVNALSQLAAMLDDTDDGRLHRRMVSRSQPPDYAKDCMTWETLATDMPLTEDCSQAAVTAADGLVRCRSLHAWPGVRLG